MIRIFCIVGITIVLLLSSTVLATENDESDTEQAVILSNSCNNCHSLAGNYISIGPSISNYKAAELETALKEFRDGTRPSTALSRQAKLYTDAEIRLIADFIGNR